MRTTSASSMVVQVGRDRLGAAMAINGLSLGPLGSSGYPGIEGAVSLSDTTLRCGCCAGLYWMYEETGGGG